MSARDTTQPRLQVAIVGGGLAGALMYSVLHYFRRMDVTLYEADSAVVHDSSATEIWPQPLQCLAFMNCDLLDDIDDSGAIEHGPPVFMLASGPGSAGPLFAAQSFPPSLPSYAQHAKHTSQSNLINVLLQDTSPEQRRQGKRLSRIHEARNKKHKLEFSDGEQVCVDVVIGAEPLGGRPREFVRQKSDSDEDFNEAQWYRLSTLIPNEGEDHDFPQNLSNDQQATPVCWISKDATLYQQKLEQGDQLTLCLRKPVQEMSEGLEIRLSKEEVRARCSGLEGRVPKALVESLIRHSEDMLQLDVRKSRRPIDGPLARDGVCILGNASYGAFDWDDGGVTLMIEDVMALHQALSRVFPENWEDIKRGLQAYDMVRRPRQLNVMQRTSQTRNLLFAGGQAAELSFADFTARLLRRQWDALVDFDAEECELNVADMIQILHYRSIGMYAPDGDRPIHGWQHPSGG